MALSDYGRNNTISESCIRTINHPLTNLICIIAVVSLAAFASVPTGIPPYMLAPIGFMLAITIDPADLISRLRARPAKAGSMAACTQSGDRSCRVSGNGWSLRFSRQVQHVERKAQAERRICKGTRGR